MAKSPDESLDLEVTRLMRRLTELQARLIGYEIAIAAIIGALDRSGALPLVSAKAAIDAAASGLVGASFSTEPIAVLRQLSARLGVSEPPDSPPEL